VLRLDDAIMGTGKCHGDRIAWSSRSSPRWPTPTGPRSCTTPSLGYALRLVARHGGVALVQRVLWGESASDVQLGTMLGATRAAFTQISLAFPDAFLAEANDVIAWFRPRPPGESTPTKGGPHE
jgi:hypothetical protein